MEEACFTEQLISWYQTHKRDLPWRYTKDPYLIWLSEIILQQTRVAQGLPYYEKFVLTFPTVKDLAAASGQEVLRLWQGLGYYARARNLHTCAKTIANRYGGEFPDKYEDLIKLKGIGAYTAAAVASFAFNETVPVVDGNVYRVLARVFGIKDDILSGKGQKKFRELAAQLIPEGKGDTYNQAIMEFGALQCTPLAPACLLCPLNSKCYAYQHGKQKELPVKIKKLKIKRRFLHYMVICQNDRILMKQRSGKDIWAGLYDFYLIEGKEGKSLEDLAQNTLLAHLFSEGNMSVEVSKLYKHQLTHQQLFVRFYTINITDPGLAGSLMEEQCLNDYTVEELNQLPKPILIDNFLREEIF